MTLLRFLAPAAALMSIAGAALAQSPVPPPDISPLDVSKNFVNGQPWSNGQQQITGPKVNGAFQTLYSIFNSMGTWDPVSGQFTINPLAATNFYGGQTVQKKCLAPGQTFTLPTGALPNVLVSVSDCTPGGAVNPQPLSSPETIFASTDATISGSPSFQFTVTGETVGFRRTQSNTWVPEAAINAPVSPVQLPADIGDVARPAGSNTTTIQPGAVTAAKMATGAAVGNIGYTPLNKAGDTLTGALGMVNVYAGPAPRFSNFNSTLVPQAGTTQLGLVQYSTTANYSYITPQLNIERYDNTTSSAQSADWGNGNLTPQLLLSTEVGPNAVDNPNPLAVHVRNTNTVAGYTSGQISTPYIMTGASFFADSEPAANTLGMDAFAVNLIAGQGQASGSLVNNLVGAEADIAGTVNASGMPGIGTGANHTAYWAQAAGFNNASNTATYQSAAFMATNAYTGGGWNFGEFDYSNFLQYGIYVRNLLNAVGAGGISVYNTYSGSGAVVADFGSAGTSYLKVTGDGIVNVSTQLVSQGLTYISTSYNSTAIPASYSQGLAIGWNFTNSTGEVDYFDMFKNGGHNFYTSNGSGGVILELGLTYNGAKFSVPLSTTGHFYGAGPVPSVSVSTGSVGVSTGANDNHGTINTSAAATVTVTFAQSRANNPDCTVTAANGTNVTGLSATTTKLTFNTSGAQYVTYICDGQ